MNIGFVLPFVPKSVLPTAISLNARAAPLNVLSALPPATYDAGSVWLGSVTAAV